MGIKTFLTVSLVCIGLVASAQLNPISAKDSIVIKSYFFDGLIEKLNENYISANACFAQILKIDPNNDAAHFEVANLALQQNKILDAEIAIKKALNVSPNQVWYLKLQTEIYKRSGNMQALIPTFDLLIALEPERETYYFDRANALFIAGEKEKSLASYSELEKKFGVSKASIAAKERFKPQQKDQLDADLKSLVAENPTDVKNYLEYSGLLLAKLKSEEALVYLLKAKKIEPNNYEVNLALADAYYALKRKDDAFESLKLAFENMEMPVTVQMKILTQLLPRLSNPEAVKRATALCGIALANHPENVPLILLYGDMLYQTGNLKDAKFQYEQVLKGEEQTYIAWEKLLGVQTLMGSYEEAIKTSEEALSIYPNQAVLHYYNAFALHRNGQTAEAGLALKYAMRLASENNDLTSMILAIQAEVMIDQGRLKEANIAFDKAVALAPNNYLTMSNYAYFLALRNHDLPKAERFAYKAVTALPENSSVVDTYAIVLFKLNKFEEALRYIQKALQNNDADNPVYLEHYGDILFVKGEKEMGLLQWEKAKRAGNQSKTLTRKINEKKYIK